MIVEAHASEVMSIITINIQTTDALGVFPDERQFLTVQLGRSLGTMSYGTVHECKIWRVYDVGHMIQHIAPSSRETRLRGPLKASTKRRCGQKARLPVGESSVTMGCYVTTNGSRN